MMRSLNEHIAKRANKEDGVRGRFWEGRFKCQPLLDERGLLTCMAYVDLNPMRANMTNSLEGSDFTSVQERLMDLARKKSQHRKQTAPETLAPFAGQESGGESEEEIPMDFEAYIDLLESTMEGLAAEKTSRRTVVARAPSVLVTMGLNPAAWLAAIEERKLGNASFLGAPCSAEEAASARGKQWLHG
ncbi:MAG: transposase, partial [bacterium]|nr:transposase [bacterium]